MLHMHETGRVGGFSGDRMGRIDDEEDKEQRKRKAAVVVGGRDGLMALARVAISINPALYPRRTGSGPEGMVKPMLQLVDEADNELQQFEACLGLTNLATVPELRERIVGAGGWRSRGDWRCVASDWRASRIHDQFATRCRRSCRRCPPGYSSSRRRRRSLARSLAEKRVGEEFRNLHTGTGCGGMRNPFRHMVEDAHIRT